MIKAVIFDMFETLITHFKTPLYFGTQIAADAGIGESDFRRFWDATGDDRTVGNMTFEEAVKYTLESNGKYSDELLEKIVKRRHETKVDTFRHLHEGIIPMLEGIRSRGLKTGLISNCFSEEVPVIRGSVLYPFFDSLCLSYEMGIKKPDPEIFTKCADKLSVLPNECLYVGDGGACELEAASSVGMTPLQAAWYLDDSLMQVSRRRRDMTSFDDPSELLEYIDKNENK